MLKTVLGSALNVSDVIASNLFTSTQGGQIEVKLELLQEQMALKPMLREEVHARALRASQ